MLLFSTRSMIIAGTLLALLIGVITPAAADDAATARDIMAKNADAVVTVRLVIKMQMSMQGQTMPNEEMRLEVRGTTIDALGLTVVSLTDTNPDEIMNRIGYGNGGDFQVSTETSDVKIRLASGTEVPARVVLRDKDLDLAFVRPVQKLSSPAPFIDLSASSKLNVLDPILALSRLGKVAGRIPCATIDRVQAVIQKPRTLYVPGEDGQNLSLGVPVFAMDGKVAGLMVLRMTPGGSGSGMSSYADSSDNYLVVILPAEDVWEIAKQAPEQAAEESKPEAAQVAVETEAEAESEE